MDKLFDKITFEDTQGHPSTYRVWDSDAARIISEFTMAERRQNLMSGDGYNTIYAKLSRWYEDFKPIVFSGSYTDLENKPTIPNVYNGTLEIKRNGVSVQTFSANSALNVIANIEVPEINDNTSSATTLYSSQRIDQLIQELGPNIINNNDDTYEIDADTINQITEQVRQRIVVPPAEVDYTAIYSYIDSHMPTVGNGKLTVTVNGVKSIAQVSNGVPALLPDASNFFSANQTEDVELNLDIPQPIELIDNTTYSDNRTWSSSKIRSEILASGSLRMVILAVGTSHTDIIGEANTIYFERITNDDLYNQYEEWVWTGDAWENLGRQIIDLSAYALKTDIKDAALSIVQPSGTTTFSANETNAKSVTIPQPDWNQTNEAANDFIKNKPTISTNITSDVASDTKTVSPKAVKDFVEGKGYLTQHQDISGKADQTDLEALEDRVEILEQSSGGTTQYSYLKLIPDLDAYLNIAPVGEIVKYTGQSNNKYTRGWDYEKVNGGNNSVVIPAGSTVISAFTTASYVPERVQQAIANINTPLTDQDESMYIYHNTVGPTNNRTTFAYLSLNLAVGDPVFDTGTGEVYHVTSVDSDSVGIDHPTYENLSLSNSNSTYFKWANAEGQVVWTRHNTDSIGTHGSITTDIYIPESNMVYSSSGISATYEVLQEDITIDTPAPASWQPILMPTASA